MQNIKNTILIIIFYLLLLIPSVSWILGIGNQVSLNENRRLAPLPGIGIYPDFPSLFQKYFDDHFGLRNIFIETRKNIKLNVLQRSDNPDVVIGKNDWLFYTSGDSYLDTINGLPFSQTDLEGIKHQLEQINTYFNSQGAKFYFLVAPNKQTIYPEFLPNYMQKVRPDSKLDQIKTYLQDTHSPVAFIDPTLALKNEKSQGDLYYKYDTHWNDLGAYVAYQTLFSVLQKDFPQLASQDRSQFGITEQDSAHQDLPILLGVTKPKEKEPIFTVKNKQSHDLTDACDDPYVRCQVIIKQVNNTALPSLVMYRDSFSVSLIPFLSEHFNRSYYYWGVVPLPVNIVQKEKPTVVIYELTERELWRLTQPLFDLPK